MHGISVKLSAAALTAATVTGIEYFLTHYAHYTLTAPWATYLALAIAFGVGWVIPETATITHGAITVTNTDPQTNATTNPNTTKGTTMSNIATDANGNLLTGTPSEPTPAWPTTGVTDNGITGETVTVNGIEYAYQQNGDLVPVPAAPGGAPPPTPVATDVTFNPDGTVTINGTNYHI
jgi:hypothetical protein